MRFGILSIGMWLRRGSFKVESLELYFFRSHRLHSNRIFSTLCTFRSKKAQIIFHRFLRTRIARIYTNLYSSLRLVIVSLARFDPKGFSLRSKKFHKIDDGGDCNCVPQFHAASKVSSLKQDLALFLLNHYASSWWCCLPHHLKKLFRLPPPMNH